MRIEDFLSNDSFTMVNKKLAKTLWIWQAIYLQELISQRKRFWQNEFFFTQNNMEEELWITAKTQWRYAKELQEKWLIVIKRKGVPAKNYFTIIDMAIINIIPNGKTRTDKMSELDETKCPNPYNNNWSNKYNTLWDSTEEGNRSSIKQWDTENGTIVPQLDIIKNSDDVRELFDESEIAQYKMQLKILLKMIELWYKVKKTKNEVKKQFDWLKAKANLYNVKSPDWQIAWQTFYQKIDKRFDWHTENWKKVKNFKTSIIPFISK